jgi:hypothetical protein
MRSIAGGFVPLNRTVLHLATGKTTLAEREPARQPIVTRIVLLAATAIALLALGFYLRTLHPGVGPSLDSIELQIAARTGGIIHPPGSPQYLMLGRLAMSVLPGPTAAARLNLMSALFGAATVGVTFLLSYRLTQSLVTSCFAALTLAFAPRLWYQASIAELYSLNGLYVALVLYFLVTWQQTERPAAFWAAVTAYALSFGNHVSMILLLPAFVYAAESTDRAMLLRPRTLAITAGIVLLAAAQYLYVPIRAAANPPFCNYCPSGLRAHLGYFLGGPFRSQMFALPGYEIMARLPDSMGLLARQFLPWGLGLGIVGLWEMFRREAGLVWTFALTIVSELVFVLSYNIPDWHDFLTPVYVAFTPLLSYGALMVWQVFQPRVKTLLVRGQNAAAYTISGGLTGLMIVSLGLSVATHLPLVDQRDDDGYEVRGRALLAEAEPGAWVLMPHPNSADFYYSWAVQYLALAEADLPNIRAVAPPEVDPPPGPPPAYISWDDAAPELTPEALADGDPHVFVLDRADDRLTGLGLLPICTGDGETIAGYEVVATLEGGQPVPSIDAERWAEVERYVVWGEQPAVCPPPDIP